MSDDTLTDDDEVVVRVIPRSNAEMDPANKTRYRKPNDRRDYQRRKDYNRTGTPENGISLFRRKILQTDQKLYDAYPVDKNKGLAQCTVGELRKLGLKPFINDPNRPHHVSLRCPDCQMQSGPCHPQSKAVKECPLFGNDPFHLHKHFKLTAEPEKRPEPVKTHRL